MTPEELNALAAALAAQLRGLGIPLSQEIEPQVEINTRARRRLGCCAWKGGRFVIQVSQGILEEEALLRATLAHELLHTCYGCQNHGKRWKGYARKAGEALGLSITTTVAVQGPLQPLRQDPVKYLLRCQACGREFPRRRMSPAVKKPSRYRCPCGGKLQQVM